MEQTKQFSIWAVFGGEALTALFDLRWMIVLIVILVIADFWFGISESHLNKEDIRFSRACRRTANKLTDYFTYLIIGVVIGFAIGEPLGMFTHIQAAAVAILLPALFEVCSIWGHFQKLRKSDMKFSFKKFIVALIKKKSTDVGEAVESGFEE